MDRIRVATLQYFIRPITSWEQFRDQVTGLVETAKDYKCRLVVFPEYFTIQLLTLGDLTKPISKQVRDLARFKGQFLELFTGLARAKQIYIVGGTIPSMDDGDGERLYNDSFVFSPSGGVGVQGKLHMTRWESEEWFVSPRNKLKIFETEFGRMAVAICYDVEFPEIARAAAYAGANILVVPSCTDDRQGYLRVRYCAQARAIENQIYVIHSTTVGSLPMVPAVSLNYGQSAIYTPSDFAFSRDGILAEGIPNQETMVVGELNLLTISDSRVTGSVLPLNDSRNTPKLVDNPEIINL